MPYIPKESRNKFPSLEGIYPKNEGELNYCISRLISNYMYSKIRNYGLYNECIGVLECAKLELYRRLAAPYEDKKVIENGDVYE